MFCISRLINRAITSLPPVRRKRVSPDSLLLTMDVGSAPLNDIGVRMKLRKAIPESFSANLGSESTSITLFSSSFMEANGTAPISRLKRTGRRESTNNSTTNNTGEIKSVWKLPVNFGDQSKRSSSQNFRIAFLIRAKFDHLH
jgi:hypothetical protein